MFCIFIDNIYNHCLIHLWKRRQCAAYRGYELSVGILIYFWDWCLSNHLKHAFTKFYNFSITRNKLADLILILKSLYKYLICQEKYICLNWHGCIWAWFWFEIVFCYYRKIVICHSSGYYIMTLIRTSPNSCQW